MGHFGITPRVEHQLHRLNAHLPSSGLEFKLSQPGSPLKEKHKGGVPGLSASVDENSNANFMGGMLPGRACMHKTFGRFYRTVFADH